ncbi:serpin-Z1C-like [Ischnura elegans]|uniref:serpin-Z1C-like n=1 Tax=Ischnura elegans TaxID=197161 RepID=UPI001ED8B846|nr:serpin-Z1C-like [Ischnura elegans]
MTEETDTVVQKHVFANRLYKAIANEHQNVSKNLVMSPVSLELILIGAASGARGRTREQIEEAMGMPLEAMKRRYAPFLDLLQSDATAIRIATKMFVQKELSLRENFVNELREALFCEVGEVDFTNEHDLSLTAINGWVNEKTLGKIQELLKSGDITAQTKLVLANAIYFKGKWANPFKKELTRKDKFNLPDGSQVDVDMMTVEKRFRYGSVQQLGAEVLELPYEGEKLSMVILLPFAETPLSDLEGKVSTPDFHLSDLLEENTKNQDVTVFLPKFKVMLTTYLESVLQKLGMTLMFSDDADFSGIVSTTEEHLKVGKVVQKAYIEVNEEGTEAAASTGMVFMSKGVRRVKRFLVNRPFILMLQDQVSGMILFSGKVMDPSVLKEPVHLDS